MGHAIAILISLAAMYGAYAFVSTKILNRPQWPFKH
jgi:hypothetical protein